MEPLPRHEELRLRAFKMRVKQAEISRRIYNSGDTGFSSPRSLAVYIYKVFSGQETGAPMLDRIEQVLDAIEEERQRDRARSEQAA